MRKDRLCEVDAGGPRVNFAISQRDGKPGVQHLGIQVEDRAELAAVYARLRLAEGPMIEEGATTCCYARSEKSWIDDPQGVPWESFLTTGRKHRVRHGPDTAGRGKTTSRCALWCTELLFARRDLTPKRAPVAELRAASEADLAAIRVLLEKAGLPTTDLEATKPSFTCSVSTVRSWPPARCSASAHRRCCGRS